MKRSRGPDRASAGPCGDVVLERGPVDRGEAGMLVGMGVAGTEIDDGSGPRLAARELA